MFDCVECFLRTGEYPNFACGECGRYAAGEEMSNEEIDKYITSMYESIKSFEEKKKDEIN